MIVSLFIWGPSSLDSIPDREISSLFISFIPVTFVTFHASVIARAQDESVDEIRDKSAAQAAIERNDGYDVNAAGKRRKTAAAVDESSRSFAAAFGAQ